MLSRNSWWPGNAFRGRARSTLESQAGVSLVELMVVIVLIGMLSTIFYTFFSSSLTNYIDLQKEATNFTQLANQSARVVNVVRGATDIVSAADNELAVYAYFYPSDTYVSKVRYYIAALPDGTKVLRADLTPMSANPPLGTPQTAQMRTFTIIENFYQPAGGKLFTYRGLDNVTLNLPINDLKSIKTIQVNLAAKTKGGTPQTMSIQASLRNRKNNL